MQKGITVLRCFGNCRPDALVILFNRGAAFIVVIVQILVCIRIFRNNLEQITSSIDSGGISEKSFSRFFSIPSAKAILHRDRSDISPVDSKRFMEPRLTPEISARLTELNCNPRLDEL